MLQPLAESEAHSSPASRDRVELLGVGVDRVSHDDVLERVRGFVENGVPRRIVTVNLDYLRMAREDEGFRGVLNTADLAIADGMPLVWASRLSGKPLPHRIAGQDLFDSICRAGGECHWSVFLLGAAPGVAATAGAVMEARYPGLRISGAYSPPVGAFDAVEEQRIRTMIRNAHPDVLFVALGAPKQDLWIRDSIANVGVPVAVGVGCSFDVVAGNVLRAPAWMQRTGLEWAFRLMQEPRRLWKRYILGDLPAFFHLTLAARRNKRTPERVVETARP
jgi:N-acetylglucosaminyldiphosphoundecaprenol N-acetyl-beta-D-mannosaminyltransferase